MIVTKMYYKISMRPHPSHIGNMWCSSNIDKTYNWLEIDSMRPLNILGFVHWSGNYNASVNEVSLEYIE